MFDSLDKAENRFPTLRQVFIIAFWGFLVAAGGCAGWVATFDSENSVSKLSYALGGIFFLGLLGLILAGTLLVFAAIRGLIAHFRD